MLQQLRGRKQENGGGKREREKENMSHGRKVLMQMRSQAIGKDWPLIGGVMLPPFQQEE